MMTIKHISPSGEENIYLTNGMRYTPATEASRDISPAPDTVWYLDGDTLRPLTGGTIFVMNDYGKTVSKYDLGASMPINMQWKSNYVDGGPL